MNSEQPSNQPKSTAANQPSEEPQDPNNELFPIVGIGASAGGLEAFTQLLSHLPSDTGMGFVLVQHLAPDHKSQLTEILARVTQMPVVEVQDGLPVEPNHVYIIPPNRKMTLAQGVLKLWPRENTQGKHMPVDSLFHSLAADRGNKAIGVILSGSDGDGTRGLEAIKAEGGITFAQCEGSAKFQGMPHSAAATGQVDFILAPPGIAQELARISRHPLVLRPAPAKSVEEPPKGEDDLQQIFTLLRATTGVDFSDYKLATLKRRLLRRLVLHKLQRLEDYVRYLRENPAEVDALSQDVLIYVTSFFRDPEAFQALKIQVFPKIIQNKSPESPIRIWVAGCSTGEEVYSIAICLLELLDHQATQPTIQVFGTDINESVIAKARTGIYLPSLVGNISPERLRRFFVKVEGGYQISKRVREMCVFAKHNLTSDPPYSQLDLVSCRNVLIYLGPGLQQRVIPTFHYSLNSTGFLLLGPSESTGKFSELFAVVNRTQKIYARKLAPVRLNFNFVTHHSPGVNVTPESKINQAAENRLDLQQAADQIVWNKYAPAGIVINSDLEILQFRGRTSPYLEPAPGEPSFNLLNMARTGLRAELQTAIRQAKRRDAPVRKESLRVPGLDESRAVNVEVTPFQVAPAAERYFLVLFEAVPTSAMTQSTDAKPRARTGKGKQTAAGQEMIQLKQELAATQEALTAAQVDLQSMFQEQEAINQNLTAANEELLSSNEELQSTNEELETAKEEIQAANEELNTINEELRAQNREANQLNNDLNNLLSSVNIPILMLGSDLGIRRFTHKAEAIFNLISTDVGRPLSHIRHNINVPNLEEWVLEVIDTLSMKVQEVQDQTGHWYDLRIRPYKTADNKIEGAVVVLVDIDALKRSAQQLQAARDYAEAIVETVWQPLIVLDADLRVITANQSFYETFQVAPMQTERHKIFELGNRQWNIPRLRSLLSDILPQNHQINNFEVEQDFEQIGPRTMLLNARQLSQADKTQMILLAIEDITERKLFEAQRNRLLAQEQAARAEAEAANRAKDEFLSIVSHELRNPLNSILGWSQLLLRRQFNPARIARALEMIEQSARSQVKLIEDLLDISRITTGRLQINARQLDLAPVIRAVTNVAHVSAEAKTIQIESVLNSDSVMVTGDPDRLQQVIWNLLSNAIKFTPAGGRVEVYLSVVSGQEKDKLSGLSSESENATQNISADATQTNLKPQTSYAQIQVSDTGQGIGSDFLPYVFDRFRQADGSSTRALGGLGLGLSIVRHLVELHGGTVQAASPGEGQGTTMTLRLPLLTQPAESSQPRALEPVAIEELEMPLDRTPTLENVRVLVVDDEAGMLELLTMILEQSGAQVTAVASAREAIAVLTINSGQHDVLLSDIGMPKEDGNALIRQVRALDDESGGQIPAAALTAYVRSEEQRESLAAGFQRHIAKPVEPAQLVSIVAELADLAAT